MAGVALAAAILFLARHIAPEAPAVLGFGLAAVAGLAVIALAFTLDDEALARLTQGAAAGIGLTVVGALADPEARLRLMSFASAAFGVGLAAWLARTAAKRPRVSLGLAGLFAAALAVLSAYAAILVLVSRDLMIADFMTYRGIAIMIARLADAGNWPLLMSATAESIAQDYSWAPALVPGLALAIAWPTSRALYTFALLALYAAPALLALAILARDLARRAGLRRLPSPRPLPRPRSAGRAGRLPRSPAKDGRLRRLREKVAGAARRMRAWATWRWPSPPSSQPSPPRWRSRRAACPTSAGWCSPSARCGWPSASLASSRCPRATTRLSRR